jgi:mono/diheme cytochrome c family protein
MKQLIYTALIILTASFVLVGCDGPRRDTGKIYMPDMAYSRAYEAYSELDSNVYTMNRTDAHKIYFNAMPPAGTVKRGELPAYTGTDDSAGYKASATLQNPVKEFTKDELAEAGRLYNINCGICHGEKGTGNGPIASKIGAVANLTLPQYVSMTDGTMFHSLTYGKNNMGSYASQLDRKQRWMVINYVRTLQPKAANATVADSASVAKK